MIKHIMTNANGPFCRPNAVRVFAALAGVVFSTAFALAEAPRRYAGVTAAGRPAEGKIGSFLGEPKFHVQQVHKGGRFPNVAVAVDGTVLAFWAKGGAFR